MINSPRGFSTAWAVIKRFLDPSTNEKISILGKDYRPTLLAQIPAENLPKRFGGLCECPGGCDLSDAGPWQENEFSRSLTATTFTTNTTKAESDVSMVSIAEKSREGEMPGMDGLAVPQVH